MSRDLTQLAKRIRTGLAAEERSKRTGLQHAKQVGDDLTAAKTLATHGQWLPWLKSVGLTPRLAQYYMAVAADWAVVAPKAKSVSHFGFKDAIVLIERTRAQQRQTAQREIVAALPASDRCVIELGRMEDWLPRWSGIDALICDPPYADVACYGTLARLARPALKDDGVVVVMTTPANMADVLAVMTPHLPYQWTAAYVMDAGHERSQVWSAKMNSSWKPLLVFGHVRHWGVDVLRAGEADKSYHKWGQSVDGFRQIVERFTRPGDLVADPFLGGATTALACYELDRRFVGCDCDPAAISASTARLAAAMTTVVKQAV